jgi:hypothetical protein
MKSRLIVVTIVALAALAGCKANSSPAPGAAPNPSNVAPAVGGGTVDPCSLITTSEATAVLGAPAKDGAPHSSQNTKQCQWDAAEGATGGSVAILIYVGGQKAKWSSTMTQAQKLPKYSDIQGLGDGAFSNGFDLHILKGDDMYQIGVAGPFQDNVDRATTIAKEALARV